MSMTEDELAYRAKLNSVDRRFGVLKYALPLGVCATPLLFAFGGQGAVLCAGLVAAGALGNAWKGSEQDWVKIEGGDRKTIQKYTSDRDRPDLDRVYAQEQPTPTPQTKPAVAQKPSTKTEETWQPVTFDGKQLLDRGTSIMLMGNPGSGKSTLAAHLASTRNAPLLVLDPHFRAHKNPWGNTLVIDDKAEILTALQFLTDLIDQKDERPVTVIVDEIPSLRAYEAANGKTKVVERFILKWATEGRKFGKLAILGSQIGNVEGFGLKGQGDFLVCFSRIRLGAIAKKHASTHPNKPLREWLKSQAYPLTIDEDQAALHPHLGHHTVVKDGNPPLNLSPVSCPPHPADIHAGVTSPAVPTPPSKPNPTGHPPHPTPTNPPLSPASHTHPPQSGTRVCPSCNSIDSVRNGCDRQGRERRRCKSCNHNWTPGAN